MLSTHDKNERRMRWAYACTTLTAVSVVVCSEQLFRCQAALEYENLPAVSARAGQYDRKPAPTALMRAPDFVNDTSDLARRLPVPDPDDPLLGDPIAGKRPRTELAFYHDLMQSLGRDPGSFRAQLRACFAEGTPLAQRVAALRAVYDSRHDPEHGLFRRTIFGTDDMALRDFALRHLVQAAKDDRMARKVLVDFVRTPRRPLGLRSAAVFAIMRNGTDSEIYHCVPMLYEEPYPGVVIGAVRALLESSTPAAKSILHELMAVHPKPEVRQKLRELHARGWRPPKE